jgi:pentatricopeptide repeat domain-containing protein 1
MRGSSWQRPIIWPIGAVFFVVVVVVQAFPTVLHLPRIGIPNQKRVPLLMTSPSTSFHSRDTNQQQQQRQQPSNNHLRDKIQAARNQAVWTQQTNKTTTTSNPVPVLTQTYCDYLMAECVASDEWEWVLEVLDIMKLANLHQVRSTYTACLQACWVASNAATAQKILTAMQMAGLPPQPADLAYAILAMCRKDQTEHGWWRKAWNLVQEQQQQQQQQQHLLPIIAHDAILTCMSRDKQWKEAIRLLRSLQQQQQQQNVSSTNSTTSSAAPSLSTYRIVIECCVNANQAEQALQVLQSCLTRSHLTPTPYSFELVILALTRTLQWRRALRLLDSMYEYNVPRNLQIYNAILSALSKAREPEQAKTLLVQMRKRDGIAPDIVSFNSALAACANTPHRWRDALSILDQAHRQPGVTPDLYSYTNAIRACAKGGQIEKALTLFQVVKDKKLNPDAYTYAAAIEACAKAKMWEKALGLVQEMESRGVNPTEFIYSITIQACGAAGQWQKAVELLETMQNKNIPINLYVYNAAITALAKAAKKISKGGENHSESGDEFSSIEGEQPAFWKRARTLLEQMREDGIEPDGFSYSSAISCCAAEGRWKEALDWIEIMQNSGPRARPNKIAYTAAITSCGRAGKADEALRLFKQMKDEGHAADIVSYNALFAAFRVAKRANAAFELWNEMLGRFPGSQSQGKIATARNAFVVPDIITVTE